MKSIFELLRASKRSVALSYKCLPVTTLLGCIASLAVSAVIYLESGAIALLVNHMTTTQGSDVLSPTLLFLLGFTLCAIYLAPFLRSLKSYIEAIHGFNMSLKIEELVTNKFIDLDIAALENPKNNDLFMRAQRNGSDKVTFFYERILYTSLFGVRAIIGAVALAWLSWQALPVLFLAFLPQLWVRARQGIHVWSIEDATSQERRRYEHIRGFCLDPKQAVETKLFKNGKFFQAKLLQFISDFNKRTKKIHLSTFIRVNLVTILDVASRGLVIFWFVQKVMRGDMQIGTFVFAVSTVTMFGSALNSFFVNLGIYYSESLFVKDFFALLDTPKQLEAAKNPATLRPVTPSIEFQNVSFTYPGQSTSALENITLTIKPGEKLALVGINGAGKTTLIKLLCRFYDPTEGRILIDGQDLKTLDLDEWYDKLGIIFQNYAHYYFPVEEAISFGRSSKPIDRAAIEKAATKADAKGFIEQWPKGFEQMLGNTFDEGVEPSVGQWQKLALARMFYRDPNILILDEPTASIDAEAEANIFERIHALPDDRTAILISHRFSTVRNADTIAVLEGGELTEYGTHEELLARDKSYARLFKLQAKGYT